MYYSTIGLLALLIMLIDNHDVLLHRMDVKAPSVHRLYRRFLFSVIAYYTTYTLWGVLDTLSLTSLLYLDTVVYYVAMAAGILSWTHYVVAYLEQQGGFGVLLRRVGWGFFAAVVSLTAVNLCVPVMFWFDAAGHYHAGTMRHTMLVLQVLMFLLTAIYTIHARSRVQGLKRSRHLTVGLFGLIMAALLSIQLFYPLLPLYTIGYLLGTSLMRTFVIENDKEEYRKQLEAALAREKQQLQELSSAWELAYTDALTSAKSKLAYSEAEEEMDRAIAAGTAERIALVVFDLNGLKHINDTQGHGMGDRMIVSACNLIRQVFQHSPVYRIGGDEFVAVLQGEDYDRRDSLLSLFHNHIEENRQTGQVVVSAGMAVYDPGRDNSVERIFKRADRLMYLRKDQLKHMDGVPPTGIHD